MWMRRKSCCLFLNPVLKKVLLFLNHVVDYSFLISRGKFWFFYCLIICISAIKEIGIVQAYSSFQISFILCILTCFLSVVRAASFLLLGPLAAKMSFRRWKCLPLSAPPSTCPTLPQESSCWKLWRWKWVNGLLTVYKKGVGAGNNTKGCQTLHLEFSFYVSLEYGTWAIPSVVFMI